MYGNSYNIQKTREQAGAARGLIVKRGDTSKNSPLLPFLEFSPVSPRLTIWFKHAGLFIDRVLTVL